MDARRVPIEVQERAAAAQIGGGGNGEGRIAPHMRLPVDYKAPSRDAIVASIERSPLSFKGKKDFGAIATGPSVFPLALGEELAELGGSLTVGYRELRSVLKGGGTKEEQQKAQAIVTAHVSPDVPTRPQDLSKRDIFIQRPDVVVMSERHGDGSFTLRAGIAENETRPAGTMIIPTMMDAFGISPEEYLQTWAEHFHGRPWAAVLPREWEAYRPELEAFGKAYAERGGEYAGVHLISGMTRDEIDRAIPHGASVYAFGYTDVFKRDGTLDVVRDLAAKGRTQMYNAPDYHLETKAALTVMKQPWFIDRVDERHGGDHAERLTRWLADSYVLSVRPDQDVNWSRLIADRKKWILKRAGFDANATESRGLVMPNDPGGEKLFVDTLEAALSGQQGQWVAQEYMPSRLPQEFYHPDTDEVTVFSGASRLTPMYANIGGESRMLGAMHTVSYGTSRAHGGSGEKMVPGMAVMSPVVFEELPNVVYSAK